MSTSYTRPTYVYATDVNIFMCALSIEAEEAEAVTGGLPSYGCEFGKKKEGQEMFSLVAFLIGCLISLTMVVEPS